MLSLLLVPLIGAVVVALGSEKESKHVALGWTLISVALAVASIFAFDWSDAGTVQFEMGRNFRWVEHYGLYLWIGADSVSLLLVLLTALLGPLCVLGSYSAVQQRQKLYYASLLALQAIVTGVFIAQDVVMFYVFFELTLVPMFVLIRQWGGSNRKKASVKFFLYTFTGSILTLAGLVFLTYWRTKTPGTDWNFALLYLSDLARLMPIEYQRWVLIALLAGFAVKVPLFPVHTWLPLAHTEAPTAGSVLLAGVLLKLGTYAIYRIAMPLAPEAFVEFAPYVAGASLVGILYAGLICWTQRDVKKLVAYSSVSHLGFCILGLVAMNAIGVGGSIMYMINHGLSTGALFLCIGMIYERYHTRDMDELGGLATKMPVWSFFMVFFAMASVGLPGLNGFVSEFMCMLGAFQAGSAWGPGGTGGVLGPWFAVIAATGMVVAAMYILYMVGKIVFGPYKEPRGHHAHETLPTDLNMREITVLTPLAIACLALGLYPTPVLRALEAPIATQLVHVERFFPSDDDDAAPAPVIPHDDHDDHTGHDHGAAPVTSEPLASAEGASR